MRQRYSDPYENGDSGQAEGSFPGYSSEAGQDEIDIFAIIQVLWGRRLWIAGTTLACLALSLVYLLVATPKYRVSMQIRPGVTGYNKGEAVYGWSVHDISSWVGDGHYRPFLRKVWKKGTRTPKITAIRSQNGNFITFSFDVANPQSGKGILLDVFQGWVKYYTKDGGDTRIQQSYHDLDNQIESHRGELQNVKEIKVKELEAKIASRKRDIEMLEQKISLENKQKDINKSAIEELNQHQKKALQNTDQLVSLRDALLKERRSEGLSLLLYTNVIQQNIYNISTIVTQIAQLEKSKLHNDQTIDAYKKQIKNLKDEILNLKLQEEDVLPQEESALRRQIALLQVEKATLAPVGMVAPPIASERPVSPHRLLTVVLAVFIGLFLGVMLVWFREGWQARQNQNG